MTATPRDFSAIDDLLNLVDEPTMMLLVCSNCRNPVMLRNVDDWQCPRCGTKPLARFRVEPGAPCDHEKGQECLRGVVVCPKCPPGSPPSHPHCVRCSKCGTEIAWHDWPVNAVKLDDLVKLAEVATRPESAVDYPGLPNLKRRVMRARRFPGNTTPVSRHLHTMALALAAGERYSMLEEEPRHCAETMLLVLLDLWKTKTELARLKGKA